MNFLPLNIDKCSIISFFRNTNLINFNYNISSIQLNRVSSIRDLGIFFSSNFTFHFHFNIIVNKAFKMLDFLNRSAVQFNNKYCLKSLYYSLVKSHLEFGSQIWSPNYSVHRLNIENIQYKFLKTLSFKLKLTISMVTVTYISNLIDLNSCEIRRKLADVMFIYDLVNYNIDCPKLLSYICSSSFY
jgi:hypothetical protein